MTVTRIPVKVAFKDIKTFEYFEYEGCLYLKLPAFTCTVKEFISPSRVRDAVGDFNAVRITKFDVAEYENFTKDILVRPLKAELKIYE